MDEKGVFVEFDFTVLRGAETLFGLAKDYLASLDGIVLDRPTEARYLAGVGYLDGVTRLFESVKTKKTAVKAARDLEAAFNARMTELVPTGITSAFRNFIKVLADADVKVVICTHADICADSVKEAFTGLPDNVSVYQEKSSCYGALKWNAWRMAAARCRILHTSSVAVTGSGFGVRAALLAGMASLAVINDHVAYQDFGGADEVVTVLDTAAAKKILAIMKV